MNYAVYPVKVMNITQNHTEGNHKDHTDFPFDEACADVGRDYMYCPCDKMEVTKLYGVGNGGVNTVWLTSATPVDMPCGKAVITMMVEHVEDEDLRGLSVGQVFCRGDKMFREGKDGASGNHFHISVGTGKMKGGGWENNGKAWVLSTHGQAKRADEVFYIENTRVRNAAGYDFKMLPKEEIALDNKPDSYAEKAVAWALKNGIIRGDTKGDLMLHQPITRQDLLVMMYRSRGKI